MGIESSAGKGLGVRWEEQVTIRNPARQERRSFEGEELGKPEIDSATRRKMAWRGEARKASGM